ncbi:MAG: TetR/AcrR family transcriptional regulator [Chloroflexi bacterium]|mgnify:FL=1|nr:TetR/AcrR family transcriptional regulator [Chloroflexota bacterium]MBK6712711.1 TetR/AcrR family transcriptional regulator [Chloroflexota bacterium]MBK7177859.1 TetR/AcrR family transcriptional regulator [Chloroflexota bacterium]MBK7916200.1 TetR/AcrR family transcriptional regulator [Chloroflexota bacterium]MBK8930815.1 TetR/AcrR family transcriptional regulator [Chloroflexota bacterium]
MPYQSSDKTRQKKDAKRTAMMQAAVRVFSAKGYHAATIRDIVSEAEVAVGTFYFYFPDKETLFVHLYEETAQFLLQAIQQATQARATLPQQMKAGLQAYVNIAVYEPAVVQLLLVGGVGAVPALTVKRAEFRERLTLIWQRPLDKALLETYILPQNTRRTAEAFAGAFDEVVLNLLNLPAAEQEAGAVIQELLQFALRAAAYTGGG